MKQSGTLLMLFFYFFTLSLGQAQQTAGFICGFDGLRNPAQAQRFQSFEEQLQQYFSKKKESNVAEKGMFGLPYVVPVVVHIIHNGGPENISDARVLAAIDHMNEGFAAQGYFAQQGAVVNTQIQFCLARRDPDGNATTGITRMQSPLTNMTMETQDIQTKDLSRWNPKDYVNIWVVKEITSLSMGDGVAGYAYFPNAHGQPEDGMICEARFFGISHAEDAVLIHEMGHYFGLYHTFEGGCPNADCEVNGDRVCDTPPDNATHSACPYNSCPTDVAPGSPFTTDVDDFVNDFMDYSPFSCYHFFTAGQADRMQGSVETVRKSLLDSKGCVDPCTKPISAAFLAAPNPVIAGQTVVFANNSTGATQYSWSENGVVFSQNTDETRLFNTPGGYFIVLTATNSDQNCNDTAGIFIQVKCPLVAGFSADKIEIEPGQTVNFTNTSTGASSFTWSVNGFELATTVHFSFLFQNPGVYAVTLGAVGPYCTRDKTIQILVKSSCGQTIEAQVKYTVSTGGAVFSTDLVGLPDGSVILVGVSQNRPLVSRLGAGGNIIWQKTMQKTGTFTDLAQLPNGDFVLIGELEGKLMLARIDADGNFIWNKLLQTPDNVMGLGSGTQQLAVNPDGSFGFFFRSSYGYLGKASLDGNLLWMNKCEEINIIGGLERATDGSGDLLLTNIHNIGGLAAFVVRVNQAGGAVAAYQYTFPQKIFEIANNPWLAVHPDGDFSFLFSASESSSIPQDKFMVRCKPDGQPRWAWLLKSSNLFSTYLNANYTPGNGWLVTDYKEQGGAVEKNRLFRYDDAGDLLWNREVGSLGFFSNSMIGAIFQNGRVRGIRHQSPQMELLEMPDSEAPIPCLPGSSLEETRTVLPILMTEVQFVTTAAPFIWTDEMPVFTNAPLARSVACSAVLPCPEICDNQLDDDEDGYVDCFDTDCDCFDQDTSCTIVLPMMPLHLAQITSLNLFATHKLKVPDANITLDSILCRTDSLDVFMRICNVGKAVLPLGTPLAFYIGNPTNTAATWLFSPVLLPEKTDIDACQNIKLRIPATYNTAIFVVVNDDGSIPRPFNLMTNFPSTDQPECHYENNMASFSFPHQLPLLDIGPDQVLCQNSVVELVANPGFQRYRWQNGSIDFKFTANGPGKYWVDAFDGCGFRQTDTINIYLNTLDTLNLPDQISVCFGETVNLAASGFSDYSWWPTDSVSCADCAAVNLLAQKNLTLYLTAAKGNCFVTDSVQITVHPNPVVQLSALNGSCGTFASITPIVSGAAPFAFQWSNLTTDSILIVSQPGTYTVEIVDQNGCGAIDSSTVLITNNLNVISTKTGPLCANSTTGSVDLAVGGGVGPYQFLWSNSAVTEDLYNVGAGAYSVVITDANGCTTTISETLTAPPAIVLVLQTTNPACAGAATGALNLTASGGTGALQYLWSTNAVTEDLSNTASGVYSVVVSDANGCTTAISETLTAPPAIVLELQTTNPACAGAATGALNLTASGGTGALQYLWSNNAVTEDLNNTASGVYSVVVSDVNGCTTAISETLTAPPAIVLELQTINPACAGAATGALNLTASGGTGVLQYLWSNNAVTEDLNNTASGVYSVVVSDVNGCTTAISETLTAPPAIVLALQITNPACAGAATGALDLTATGGTGALQYLWSNNAVTEDLNNALSGVYTVVVSDANGCTTTASETLNAPPVLSLILQANELHCPGDTILIDASASGGTPPFTFAWSSGETTEDIKISKSGTYDVNILDSKGCVKADSISIATLGAAPILQWTTDTLTCQKTIGSISVSSNLPNSTFAWSSAAGFSSNLANPSISTNGTFVVTVTEPTGGCTSVASVFVPIDTIAPTIVLANDILEIPCDQDSIFISAAGSSNGPNIAIDWTSASGGVILSGGTSLSPLVGSAGVYQILITDLTNGCTLTDGVEVLQLGKPTAIVATDSVRCFGETNGVIRVVSVSGGIQPLTYSIDNQNFTEDVVFENLSAGQYVVYVRDAKGCLSITETEVAQPGPVTVELTGDSLVVAGEAAYLQAFVSPPGFVPAQINWLAKDVDFVKDQLVQSVVLFQHTMFQINIADEHGCSASDTWLVRVNSRGNVFLPNVIAPGNQGGINQVFLVFSDDRIREIASLDIYDRWGNQVFSNRHFQPNDETQGWDGLFRGKAVAPGVFAWVLKLVYMDGSEEILSGDVTIVR